MTINISNPSKIIPASKFEVLQNFDYSLNSIYWVTSCKLMSISKSQKAYVALSGFGSKYIHFFDVSAQIRQPIKSSFSQTSTDKQD